jgi:hypothetical protein
MKRVSKGKKKKGEEKRKESNIHLFRAQMARDIYRSPDKRGEGKKKGYVQGDLDQGCRRTTHYHYTTLQPLQYTRAKARSRPRHATPRS